MIILQHTKEERDAVRIPEVCVLLDSFCFYGCHTFVHNRVLLKMCNPEEYCFQDNL